MASPDREMQVAAVAFSAATVLGSMVSIRQRLPGEPLGIRLPISVAGGVLLGWGAGVAAPWPMPLMGLLAANGVGRLSRRSRGLICAGLGTACIAGTLVEPVMRRPRTWTRGTGGAIAANITSSLLLIAAGLLAAGSPAAGSRTQ
jgi:hypothetical protein